MFNGVKCSAMESIVIIHIISTVRGIETVRAF